MELFLHYIPGVCRACGFGICGNECQEHCQRRKSVLDIDVSITEAPATWLRARDRAIDLEPSPNSKVHGQHGVQVGPMLAP